MEEWNSMINNLIFGTRKWPEKMENLCEIGEEKCYFVVFLFHYLQTFEEEHYCISK